MKAMVLAAGLGTRLRPLTDDRPKALVEVAGRTLLEITLTRLKNFGVREVIVNVHHFAEKVVSFLAQNHNFGMRIEISSEEGLLLDTGGGLKKAAWFFLEGNSGEPFLLHNVDVVSTIDLHAMIDAQRHSNSLATLAVQQRDSSRYLLFDENLQLCGRRIGRESSPQMARAAHKTQQLAFCGIHVISPKLLPLITEAGVFSIIDSYLRLAAAGQKISAFHADASYWRDLGKLTDLEQAARDLQQHIVSY
jgi:NDP-sugar pyrophosphorylase family protein